MEPEEILKPFGLDRRKPRSILGLFAVSECAAGENVFRQGEGPDRFYFVRSGEVLVSRRTRAGDDEPLAVLNEGQFFGEIGLLEGIPRTASVKALVDVELLQL